MLFVMPRLRKSQDEANIGVVWRTLPGLTPTMWNENRYFDTVSIAETKYPSLSGDILISSRRPRFAC